MLFLPQTDNKEEAEMKLLSDLFLTFTKIGLFTFGGGYAMVPVIEHACVDQKQWITHDDMMNITVIAESTPGPIAINCATFVGYRQKGLIGAITATLGIVLPSLMIIFLIALLLDGFLEITVIRNAFKGIKLAVGLLILDAALRMIRKMPKKPLPRLIMGGTALMMTIITFFSLRFSSVSLMLCAGLVSLSLYALRNGKAGKKP